MASEKTFQGHDILTQKPNYNFAITNIFSVNPQLTNEQRINRDLIRRIHTSEIPEPVTTWKFHNRSSNPSHILRPFCT